MTANDRGIDVELGHNALLYSTVDDYVKVIAAFVGAGVAADEPVLVAVPRPKAELLRQVVAGKDRVTFLDMCELGRNPARIIPAVRSFVHTQGGRPTRLVAEPTWPGRSAAELGEVILHESLLDSGMSEAPSATLCPYDTTALDPDLICEAERHHSHLVIHGGRRRSPTYQPGTETTLFSAPLSAPPWYAEEMVFDHDLGRLRRFVEAAARKAGLETTRLQDLLLAVNEVATNAIVHAGTSGVIRCWHDVDASEMTCDLRDEGHIGEPLVGRFGPYPLAEQGWGLWMVNQVCDLVELRSGAWGTNVRLHVRLQ